MSFLTVSNRCKSLVTQPLTTRVISKVYWGVKYQEFSITRDFCPFYCIPRCFFDLFSNHRSVFSFWKHLVLRSTSYRQNHCSNPSLRSHTVNVHSVEKSHPQWIVHGSNLRGRLCITIWCFCCYFSAEIYVNIWNHGCSLLQPSYDPNEI